jgi:hypothetical protein
LGACSKISRPTYKSDGPPCPWMHICWHVRKEKKNKTNNNKGNV